MSQEFYESESEFLEQLDQSSPEESDNPDGSKSEDSDSGGQDPSKAKEVVDVTPAVRQPSGPVQALAGIPATDQVSYGTHRSRGDSEHPL